MATRIATLGLCSLLLMAGAAHAQEWNRRVEAISAVPNAAGGHTVRGHVSISASDLATTIDLSTEVLILVNGTAVHSEILTVSASGDGGACGGTCGLEACMCHGVPVECSCGGWITSAETETSLQPNDEIMVLLRPASGAIPEQDQDDDVRTILFEGETLGWNRRLDSVEIHPRPGEPGVVDLLIQPSMSANNEGRLDHTSTYEILVNGEPVPVPVPDVFGDLTWNPCAGNCGTVCALHDETGEWWGGCLEDPQNPGPCTCRIVPIPDVVGPIFALPGDLIEVHLVPLPGALPELPGFPDDDEDEHTVPNPCPGDVNGSGAIDFNDLLAILAAWGPCAGCPEDVNGDDEVGFADLLAVLAAWGPCEPV